MSQKYCSSCGSLIGDNQGSSCSMCYGDPHWGNDGYYLAWIEEAQRQEQERQEAENVRRRKEE